MLSAIESTELNRVSGVAKRYIVDVEAIMVRPPEVKPIADGCQSIMILKVYTDDGLVGIGEVHTNPLVSRAVLDAPLCSAASRGLRQILAGQDANDITGLWRRMYRYSSTFGRRGAVMHVIHAAGQGTHHPARPRPRRGIYRVPANTGRCRSVRRVRHSPLLEF